MYLKEGCTLNNGRYRIVRFLAAGGFGATYQAEHTALGHKVAIKELFISQICNRDRNTSEVTVGVETSRDLFNKMRGKFINEARALSQLHHPYIVGVSDFFEENGTAYYVMEFVDGKSIGQIVKQRGPMKEDVAIRLIDKVAEALGYVHSQNRLHLDIKPDNIMVTADGTPKIIDFGISKSYDAESGKNATTLLGRSPGYAPPEQQDGLVGDFLPATDIYSLGATLYHMLTGEHPVPAPLLAAGTPLAPLPPEISPETRAAIAAAMTLNKHARPQRVTEFMDILTGNAIPPAASASAITSGAPATQFAPGPPTTQSAPGTQNAPGTPGVPATSPYRPDRKANDYNDKPGKKSPSWLLRAAIIAGVIIAAAIAIALIPKKGHNAIGRHDGYGEDSTVEAEEVAATDTIAADIPAATAYGNRIERSFGEMATVSDGTFICDGYFEQNSQQWPIELQFKMRDGLPVSCKYINPTYGNKSTMNVACNSDAIVIYGDSGGVDFRMEFSPAYGDKWTGWAQVGSKDPLSAAFWPR